MDRNTLVRLSAISASQSARGQAVQRPGRGHAAGVVEGGVEALEARHGRVDERRRRALVGDVGGDVERAAAVALDRPRRGRPGLLAARAEHDRGALGGHPPGKGEPDPARPAGDEDDPAGEALAHVLGAQAASAATRKPMLPVELSGVLDAARGHPVAVAVRGVAEVGAAADHAASPAADRRVARARPEVG